MRLRESAVSGTFYPGDATSLVHFLSHALMQAGQGGPQPKALIVPHAGYIYSATTAAKAYARLIPYRDRIRRVVLIGPSHRVPLRGIAVPDVDAFVTPLGVVPLDLPAVRSLLAVPGVVQSNEAHRREHSLEVQLPFLQHVLGDFQLIPLVIGLADAPLVERVLSQITDEDGTVTVISSDLSHFLPYETAIAVDRETSDQILALSDMLTGDQACGCYAVNGALRLAKSRQWQVEELALINSGDTAGDKARVVGYGAYVLH